MYMIKKSLILMLLCFSIYAQTRVKFAAFDGGGVRGVITLEIIQAIEKYGQFSLSDQCAGFGGTSTGAIIAIGLALGIPASELSQYYQHLSSEVFAHGHPHLFHAQYDPHRFKEALLQLFHDKKISPDICLKDLPKKVVLPVLCLKDPENNRWEIKLLENFSEEGGQVKVTDAVVEVTSAPTFFPSSNGYIDAGVVVNNPSLATLAHAHQYYLMYDENINIDLLSIGTGFFEKYIEGNEDWGSVQWMTPVALYHTAGAEPLINMMVDVSNYWITKLCYKLFPNSFHRINMKLSKNFTLDQVSAIPEMIQETQQYIKDHESYIQKISQWFK